MGAPVNVSPESPNIWGSTELGRNRGPPSILHRPRRTRLHTDPKTKLRIKLPMNLTWRVRCFAESPVSPGEPGDLDCW